MTIASLLEKLKPHAQIKTIETIHPDGTRVYVFSSLYPFPHAPEPAWYVIVTKPGQTEVDNKEIEAMLRHLWMFQLDILPHDLAASSEE